MLGEPRDESSSDVVRGLGGESQKLGDWLLALAVTSGATKLLMTGPLSSHGDAANTSCRLRILLSFLVVDGFASTFQQVRFKQQVLTDCPPGPAQLYRSYRLCSLLGRWRK